MSNKVGGSNTPKSGEQGFQKSKVGKVAPTASVTATVKLIDRNPVKTHTDLEKLKIVQKSWLLAEIVKSFPDNLEASSGALLYNEVAQSMLHFDGDLADWKRKVDIGPDFDNLVGIWTLVNNLGVWNSRAIERQVADRGVSIDNLTENLMVYLGETYEWAYDSLMEYIGGYIYVTNEYGHGGKWVKQGTPIDNKSLIFNSPAAQRAEQRRERLERRATRRG